MGRFKLTVSPRPKVRNTGSKQKPLLAYKPHDLNLDRDPGNDQVRMAGAG